MEGTGSRRYRSIRQLIQSILEERLRLNTLRTALINNKNSPNAYRSNIISQNNSQKKITHLISELNSKINTDILDITYKIGDRIDNARLVNLKEEEVNDLFDLLSMVNNVKIEILEIRKSKTYISKSKL